MKTKTSKILLMLLMVSIIVNLVQFYFSSTQAEEQNPENMVLHGTYVDEDTSRILLLESDAGSTGLENFTLESYGMDGVKVQDSGQSHKVAEEAYRLSGDNDTYYVIRKDNNMIGLLDTAQNTYSTFEKKDDVLIYGAIPEGVQIK